MPQSVIVLGFSALSSLDVMYVQRLSQYDNPVAATAEWLTERF